MSHRKFGRKRGPWTARAIVLAGAAVGTAVMASSIAMATVVAPPSFTPSAWPYLASNGAANVTSALCRAENGCGPVVTAPTVLTNGTRYDIQVIGAVSPWSNWSYIQCGTPGPTSEFQIRGDRSPNPTSDDAQFRFAQTLYSGHCPTGKYPVKTNLFQINLGAGWVHPIAVGNPTQPSGDEDAANDQHPYTFLVTGDGVKPAFRYVDYYTSDNHGRFKITITAAP